VVQPTAADATNSRPAGVDQAIGSATCNSATTRISMRTIICAAWMAATTDNSRQQSHHGGEAKDIREADVPAALNRAHPHRAREQREQEQSLHPARLPEIVDP